MASYLQDKIGSLEHRQPVFARSDETLRAVAHTMWVENVGALVVGDEQRSLGIISERDVVALVAQGADLDAVTAEDAMVKHVVAARVGDTLADAAYQMLDGAIRHLPVLDDQGHVVGMVSVRDLLRPALSGGTGGTD
jgi:CBS domain-containing protein